MREEVLYSWLLSAVLVLAAGAVQAGEVVCRGSISSVQGEGLVARTHRFEIYDVSGGDLMASASRPGREAGPLLTVPLLTHCAPLKK